MPYLTNEEYIARYGEAETIRVTDEARTGTVDSAKLEAAIADASEEVDTYLGKRYTIPLVDPPNLVKSMTGAIAREDLHRIRPAQAVTDDAARARSQLRDISKGVAILPTVDGGAAEEDARAPADSSASGDGPTPIFTEDNLAGFGVPSGYAGACWRQ